MSRIKSIRSNAAPSFHQALAIRALVFGNSGSGKSTFARSLAARHDLRILALDHVVWSQTEFAKFRLDDEIGRQLGAFVAPNPSSVVEGCDGRWTEFLQSHCTEMVFLNPREAAWLANCRGAAVGAEEIRDSGGAGGQAAVPARLVHGSYSRTDNVSLSAHRRLFESFSGAKQEIGATEMSHS